MDDGFKIHVGEAVHDGRGHVIIRRQFEFSDGRIEEGVYVMPDDVLEWRAAEYGMDPSDLDSIMELVLQECHVTPPADEDMPPLFTAATVAKALEIHSARCGEVGKRHLDHAKFAGRTKDKITPTNDGWKDLFVMHAEALAIKRQMVTQRRAVVQTQLRQARKTKTDPHRDRIERLKGHLMGGSDA